MPSMSPEAEALAQALLDQHKDVCRQPGAPSSVDSCLVTYGELCSRARVPYLTHKVGHFLQQVAHWCEENGWPPINALAVNQETRMPGGGYDGAPGCNLLEWPTEVKACIEFRGYPGKVT